MRPINSTSKIGSNFKTSLLLLFAFSLLTSCTTESVDEVTTPPSGTNLHKRVILYTSTANPDYNTKEVQYYSNNQIVADTVFNHLNQWTARKIILTNGTTKTFQTLDTNNQITEHREETYDSQGRITSRRTYVPLNLIVVTYTYNSDNTVTANAYNIDDMTTTYVGTYFKNSSGLIYREERPGTANPAIVYQNNLQFDNSKPVSINYAGSSTVPFSYYPNPKPTALLKSVDELNNRVLYGLSLTRLAEEGNFYYKRNDETSVTTAYTYTTTFNSANYIEYYKMASLTLASNNMTATEVFYYYN